jgi:2-haloalkanoic acid dehalogenase type II
MSTSQRSFSSFRVLSFDIYGTLVDWETGILEALRPLIARIPPTHSLKTDHHSLQLAFNKIERRVQSQQPDLVYTDVLACAYYGLAIEVLRHLLTTDDVAVVREESVVFAKSIAHWPAFSDTVDAMRRLKQKGYKLVPVSNVDRASFQKTLSGPLSGLVDDGDASSFFDAVYTAQDIGSYKPDSRNFDYLISHVKSDLGVSKEDILHVAQSLFHDHEPAKKAGLESVWIARGEGGVSGMGGDVDEFVKQGRVGFGWKFSTLGEFADAVESG